MKLAYSSGSTHTHDFNGDSKSDIAWRDTAGKDRHQAPTHIIIANDGQQSAVQDVDLFVKHPRDNEQRFDQYDQIGEVLDKLLDAHLEFGCPHHHLEAEARQAMMLTKDEAGRTPSTWRGASVTATLPIAAYAVPMRTCRMISSRRSRMTLRSVRVQSIRPSVFTGIQVMPGQSSETI
jgi:hypothetical protein